MAEWKALIANVAVKQDKSWLKPGDQIDQKKLSAGDIQDLIENRQAHFELRGRPDKAEPKKPEKGKEK